MLLNVFRKPLWVLSIGLAAYFQCAAASSLAANCTPDAWTVPADASGAGMQAVLKDIPAEAKWADLPDATKARLQKHAEDRLTAFRARWASDALRKKETILLTCPTPEMISAFDDYYRRRHNTVVSPTFTLTDVRTAALRQALVRNYLTVMAGYRATLTYPSAKHQNRDWDGKSLFDSVRLPDKRTYEDIKSYAAELVRDLKKIDDASLDDLEKVLRREVLFDARALSVGAFTGDSFGGADMEMACQIVALSSDVVQGYNADRGRPKIFATDEAVLREVNAIYLHNTALRWLDRGTLHTAINLNLCDGMYDDVQKYVGDPTVNDVAKGILLLKKWWIERVSASADAQNKCSIYSAQERAQIWEAFSADQHFNNDGSSSIETFKAQLDAYRVKKIHEYRVLAKVALQKLFPDDVVLTVAQRQQVLAAIDAETAFGLILNKVAAILDTAQATANGPAATIWNNAIAAYVVGVGGNYAPGAAVRPDDEAAIKTMYEEVKRWIADRYRGYPIEVASLFDKFTVTVTTDHVSSVKTDTGNMRLAVGTKRAKTEYYSTIIHELRHAVDAAWRATAPDRSKVSADVGPAIEGSGVAAELLLLEPFLKATLQDDITYAMYALAYAIRDARFVATTDAALQKYLRRGCSAESEPDTVDFAKRIAESYGLTGGLAVTLATRVHAGTQYFQYISGGLQILDDIGHLQKEIAPNNTRPIDPFVLFACGLNTPRRDAGYVSALKVCMMLRRD